MHYTHGIEEFKDFEDFTQKDSCVWIVYPAGAAGDLVASIVNFHYIRTGARCFGISDTGRVIFRDSGKKVIRKSSKLDQNLIYTINQKLGEENLNKSLIDQLVFSNHKWQPNTVAEIVDFFPNSKVIRIIPRNNKEHSIINWLENYKNQNLVTEFLISGNVVDYGTVNHPRVLELYFGDLLNASTFEMCYDKIVQHLDLDYKLIRFDFVKFWISKQHPTIKSIIEHISS